MTQLELAARPPPSKPRAVPGGELFPAIKAEVLAALLVYGLGRERAIKGERLAEMIGPQLMERGHPHDLSIRTLTRRIQESVAELVEGGEIIGSVSSHPAGYYIPKTAEELLEAGRGLRAHLISSARRLRAYDRVTADKLLQLLGQETLQLPRGAPGEGQAA